MVAVRSTCQIWLFDYAIIGLAWTCCFECDLLAAPVPSCKPCKHAAPRLGCAFTYQGRKMYYQNVLWFHPHIQRKCLLKLLCRYYDLPVLFSKIHWERKVTINLSSWYLLIPPRRFARSSCRSCSLACVALIGYCWLIEWNSHVITPSVHSPSECEANLCKRI